MKTKFGERMMLVTTVAVWMSLMLAEKHCLFFGGLLQAEVSEEVVDNIQTQKSTFPYIHQQLQTRLENCERAIIMNMIKPNRKGLKTKQAIEAKWDTN